MSAINSIKQVQIYPTNRANADNTWSYKNGNPTLIFSLGSQDLYLRSSTMRLSFKLRIKQAGGDPPNNNNADAGTSSTVPTIAEVDIRQNAKIGAMACFQSINISNSKNQTLENVVNFPRLLSSITPTGANFHDYATYLGVEMGATANDGAQGRLENGEMEVCCRILAGMFLTGADIPLGGPGKGTDGLQIRLSLAPSIEANFGANAAGSYYEVSNPVLTASLGVPAGGALPSISAYPYNSFSSYYNVLNNGDETQNINCGLSSVISVFTNFIPTSYIANLTEDGNETYSLNNDTGGGVYDSYAPVSRYSVTKGGILKPYSFTVDETRNISQEGVNFSANYTAQRQRNYLSSLAPMKDRTSTLAGNISENGLGVSPVEAGKQTVYNTLGKHVYGLGARFDGLGEGAGANFSNQTFSHRITSKLDGVSANSAYTFMFHKNLIQYGGGGISVTN